ncbi:MAG: hypothetical protein ACTSWN_05960, partial [Promethearchaeota archaeon]
MDIFVYRNINYLYVIICLALFCVVACHVAKNNHNKKLLKSFLIGTLVGVGFELLMVISGQRDVNLGAGDIYNPIISLIMGASEIGGTTTMAHIFTSRNKDKGGLYFSLSYLSLVFVALLILYFLSTFGCPISLCWFLDPVKMMRKVNIAGILFSIGITIICLIIMLKKIKRKRYIIDYFLYLVAWGSIYVITLLVSGFRGYEI